MNTQRRPTNRKPSIPTKLRVYGSARKPDLHHEAGLSDLSCSGALVETAAPLKHRDIMEVVFTLPELGHEVRAFADVLWLNKASEPPLTRAGIRFIYLHDDDRETIARESARGMIARPTDAETRPEAH